MPASLSELLERIRPAGTPGAPARGDGAGAVDDRLGEMAPVIDELARYEEAARAVVAAAEQEAADRRARADREVTTIEAELPERLARAAAAVANPPVGPQGAAPSGTDGSNGSLSALTEAERQIERLRQTADTAIPELARDVAARIRRLLLEDDRVET